MSIAGLGKGARHRADVPYPDGHREDVLIFTRNLSRRFDSLVAVDSLNLEVHKGEIFGLVGPDGAGKTTTLRMLCGLMNPTEGEAWVAGRHVQRDFAAVKDHIGYMAQRVGLYNDLTVDENMEFYGDLFGVSSEARGKLTPRLLHITRLEPFRNRQAGKLSGGMRQKLALMCTLLHRPEILFLDEPTNGVDPVSRREFWAILYEIVKEGVTVFVTTAYLDEAERCDRVGLLHEGRLIRLDSPSTLRRHLGEHCYELSAPDLRSAREKLARTEGVHSVQACGTTLHLFLDPLRTSPELLRSGIAGAAIRPIEPSLEDVFISLLQPGSSKAPTSAAGEMGV